MKKTIKYLLLMIAGSLVLLFTVYMYWNLQPYYKKYHYVAHALGGIDNLDYTNSAEALNNSYSMGSRLMEVDFAFTSDEHLVCRHKWSNQFEDGFSNSNIPDYETFMSTKIQGKYTPLDIEAIIKFAEENPDVYFITDIKKGVGNVEMLLEAITNAADQLGYTDLKRQFIIQFYNFEDYEIISKKFSFQNYIFTLYYIPDELKQNGITNILDFCVKNNIKVVTIPHKYVTKDICEQFKKNGITSYTHTINSESKWKKFKEMGVDGIYTDYIYPVNTFHLCVSAVMLAVFLIMIILLCRIMFYKCYKVKTKSNILPT